MFGKRKITLEPGKRKREEKRDRLLETGKREKFTDFKERQNRETICRTETRDREVKYERESEDERWKNM